MAIYRRKQVFESESFNYTGQVLIPLEAFREYILATDKIISDIAARIRKNHEILKTSDEQTLDMTFDFIGHEVSIFTHQLYYNSLFISLYSFLERKLNQICKNAESGQLLKIRDLSGEGVVKYYNYIKKVLKIDMSSLNTEWSQILKYNRLRNLIVHHPTNAISNKEQRKSEIDTLNSINHLSIVEKDDVIEFEISAREFLEEFFNIVSKFLHDIYYEKG